MPRWSVHEQQCLEQVREAVADLLHDSPQYPEVVGDRKIIRFLRGHDHDVEKVSDLYGKYLLWYKSNNIAQIRNSILNGEADHPLRFPKGKLILSLIPQLNIAPDNLDKFGCPLCVEQYDFSPSEVMKHISVQDYVLFTTYCLEYRALVLEQMSELKEQSFLQQLSEEERKHIEGVDGAHAPYGVIAHSCVIRDLKGVGFEHLGSKGLEIISEVVKLASDNYPELMRKCFMINTPFVFHTVWYFVKGLLSSRTLAKMSVLGSGFADELRQELPPSNWPTLIGGSYVGFLEYQQYAFDTNYFSGKNTAHSVECPLGIHEQEEVLADEDSTEQDEKFKNTLQTTDTTEESNSDRNVFLLQSSGLI